MFDATLGWTFYWGWLLLVNLVTFVMFRNDKGRAQRAGARRVPESTLLLLLAGGGVVGGAFAMYMRPRHKTRKPIFLMVLIVASLIHAYLAAQALGLNI